MGTHYLQSIGKCKTKGCRKTIYFYDKDGYCLDCFMRAVKETTKIKQEEVNRHVGMEIIKRTKERKTKTSR